MFGLKRTLNLNTFDHVLLFHSYPRLLAALSRAMTFVAVGIHHLDLLKGGKDLSAGGNCLIVTNCSKLLRIDLNLLFDNVLNQ